MKLIGLSGKKQSGKDSIYRIAADSLRSRVGRVGFADAVKHEVSEVTGFRRDFIEKHKSEFRTLLQVWGTEFRRHFFGNDYWIEKMETVIENSKEHYDYMFITDVRFSNEAEFIKSHNGLLVKVERRLDTYQNIQDAIASVDSHASENDMNDYSNYDYVLNNNGTEKELQDSVKSMLETLNILKNAA